MSSNAPKDSTLALSLVFAVFLWGANNTGTKLLVSHWPPVWTGGSRFFCAGLVLLGILRWSNLLGTAHRLNRDLSLRLWLRGGLVLASYIVIFNSALRYTSASHVALYLGASPIWALLWESRPGFNKQTLQRYGAAALALSGVFILFWPSARHARGNWPGEALALAASLLWTTYGRQCRAFGNALTGAETSAHTMWRAGVLLLPIGILELATSGGLEIRTDLVLVQLYCILGGGVAAFAIWTTALRWWPASKVLLFNNFIPLSTTLWARFWLKEQMSPTFWVALLLVLGGVVLAQWKWETPFPVRRPVPPE
jgi:drug/metabolite transporter (DMT)-like permease